MMSSSPHEGDTLDLLELMRGKMRNKLGDLGELGAEEPPEKRTARFKQAYAEALAEISAEVGITLSEGDRRRLYRSLLVSFDSGSERPEGLLPGNLEWLLLDDVIQEILVIGPNQVLIRRADHEQFESAHGTVFEHEEHLLRIISRILTPLGVHLDADTPFAQMVMPDGSQVRVLLDTLGTNQTVLFIHKASQPKREGPPLNLLKRKDNTP